MSSPPMRQARRISRAPSENFGDSRRRSTSRSGIPMPNTALRASRATTTQPTYDFLSGGSAAPSPAVKPLGQSLRQSQNVRPAPKGPSIDDEELRAKIKSLQYEVDDLKSQRDYTQLQHEKAIRDAVTKAEQDFQRQHADEGRRAVPIKKYEEVNSKLKDAQDQVWNTQAAHDKELRKIKDERRIAQGEADEARTDLMNLEGELKRSMQDANSKQNDLEREIKDLKTTLLNSSSTLEIMKDKLAKKEAQSNELEGENVRMKAQMGDTDTLEAIKRDLTEQVSHIRKLESTNRDQSNQLKAFRQKQKAVEVVEEEKRTLQVRLDALGNLENELQEARLQRQILEDERRGWTSYLQSQAGEADVEFGSPVEMARALVRERVENASTMERLGALQSEILEKDGAYQILAGEKSRLQSEVEALKANGSTPAIAPPSAPAALDSRTRKALERQRGLALKEVEFLREQLRSFDSEEQTYHAEENQFDTVKTKRIADLEQQVDDHRRELANLTSEISTLETQAQVNPPKSPLKRPREDEDEKEVAGQLARKNRKLQDEFSNLQTAHNVLQSDHGAIKSQLATLQERSKTRVLSLRSNPTADFEAIKLNTLETLKKENKDLLARLKGADNDENATNNNKAAASVPNSTLDALRLEIKELERTVAEKEKRMLRLKQIWGSKSLEFREAVFSLLGWRMDFRPNGKFALSLQTGNRQDDDDDDGDAMVEETLIFDGEKGTMKVAGGMDSSFAREVRPLTREWVEQKRYIPGLMASVLLSKVGDGTVAI